LLYEEFQMAVSNTFGNIISLPDSPNDRNHIV
jgi:hypothetical protein